MRARQRELCLRRVIEAGRRPGDGRVAELAILRESGGCVARALGGLVILDVTRGARRAQRRVLTIRMALLAGYRRVRAC